MAIAADPSLSQVPIHPAKAQVGLSCNTVVELSQTPKEPKESLEPQVVPSTEETTWHACPQLRLSNLPKARTKGRPKGIGLGAKTRCLCVTEPKKLLEKSAGLSEKLDRNMSDVTLMNELGVVRCVGQF